MMKTQPVALLMILWFSLSTVVAQDTEMCWGCIPSEPIIADTISQVRIISGWEGYHHDLSFSGDSQAVVTILTANRDEEPPLYVATLREQTFEIVQDVYTGRDIRELHWTFSHQITRNHDLTQIAYQPSGEHVAIGYRDGRIEFWAMAEKAIIYASQGQGQIDEILYHPNDNGILTIEDSQYIGWHSSIDSGEYLEIPDGVEIIQSLAISDDGEWLAAGTDRGVLLYTLHDFSLSTEILLSMPVGAIAFDPTDTHRLFVLTNKTTLWEWEAAPTDIEQVVVFEELSDEELMLTDIGGNLSADYRFTDAAINPDGSVLIALDTLGCTRTWLTHEAKEILTPFSNATCKDMPIYDLAFSPDGLWLIFGTNIFQAWAVP